MSDETTTAGDGAGISEARLAAAEAFAGAIRQGADTDESLCRKCGASCHCPTDLEPTPLCNVCAQAASYLLPGLLAALRAAEDRAARLRKLGDEYLSEMQARGEILDAIQAEAGKGWWYGPLYELRRLKKALPVTGDGVLVVPGMDVWREGHWLLVHRVCEDGLFQYQTQFFKAADWYSTREAAAEALAKSTEVTR